MSEVLCDTDILSALAKAESLEILNSAFPSREFVISESVVDELKKAEEAGFEFPSRIFKFCKTTTLTERELQKYGQTDLQGLSKTDTKNIIIAKERELNLLTNDSLLYKTAEQGACSIARQYPGALILKLPYTYTAEKINDRLRDFLGCVDEIGNIQPTNLYPAPIRQISNNPTLKFATYYQLVITPSDGSTFHHCYRKQKLSSKPTPQLV
ncbi:hypothetical protein AKJ66_02805 [candidate division MSBL1 archaeon SCGC-AAA259E22]|uniref:PIN domain-containing protein n=2 Tax=candidate division MSBL1 TaxID=215777 RepID=A0A133U4K6_9EURY|nr:hypothetical protein AKJ61_03550 [candidate division MSBL1 archaeon SCGC-AAA259B11]KXA93102.1 hypothetical protein AKJ66_02805 [candidate division MSBL1 archaeon SCGC-AAA259E22]